LLQNRSHLSEDVKNPVVMSLGSLESMTL